LAGKVAVYHPDLIPFWVGIYLPLTALPYQEQEKIQTRRHDIAISYPGPRSKSLEQPSYLNDYLKRRY